MQMTYRIATAQLENFMYDIAENRRDTDILLDKECYPTRLEVVGWLDENRKCDMRKILESVVIAVLVLMLFRTFFGIAYVSGESMEPVFREGDIILFRKWGTPENGEIVTAYIEDLDCMVVKRILAAEGDRITIHQGKLYLNGKETAKAAAGKPDCPEIRLTSDQYFLIGDHQDVSLDSRTFGCIGRDAVYGIVICKLL